MVKFVVGVPESHAAVVREALGKAGAGRVGNYEYISFSVKGTGRFRPLVGAHPAIGAVGDHEEVAEEQIQTVCRRGDIDKIVAAVKQVHPYEKPPIYVSPLVFYN